MDQAVGSGMGKQPLGLASLGKTDENSLEYLDLGQKGKEFLTTA
ncbi:MAG: hypothetical protein AB7U29_17635 [Desulfobulbus sp.]